MPDGMLHAGHAAGVAEAMPVRPDRPALMAFVTDAASEAVLREALSEVAQGGLEIRRSTIRAASTALRKKSSPRTLIVDISGEAEPLAALAQLYEVVEPDIRILVIGERGDMAFYREVTRSFGALEYLYKPLQHDIVARHFGSLLLSKPVPAAAHGGRVVSVTGVRGGVGASTIAANLAWHFGVEENRPTVMVDGDLHRGTCAMLLGTRAGPGLRAALEAPDRVDDSFLEWAPVHAAGKLEVLAGEEPLDETPGCAPGANARLLDALRRRYNFVVVDLPSTGVPMQGDLLMRTHQRVLVMDATLAAVRDTLQMLALPAGPDQARRPVIVLNRAGRPGGLTRRQVEDALKLKVEVVLPDLPKLLAQAAAHGKRAIELRGGVSDGLRQLAREVAWLHAQEPGAQAPGALAGWAGRLLGLSRAPRPVELEPAG